MELKKIFLAEDKLVLALKNRETKAIKALIDMYYDSLDNVISRIIPDPESRKDVVQETIIKIWNSIGRYESSKGRLYTWMRNVAKNYAIDVVKSKSYRDVKRHVCIDLCHFDISQKMTINLNTDIIGIKDMIYNLQPKYHILMELVYFQGYTHQEAATILSLPEGTVKTRIRMAIIELRKQFEKSIDTKLIV